LVFFRWPFDIHSGETKKISIEKERKVWRKQGRIGENIEKVKGMEKAWGNWWKYMKSERYRESKGELVGI